MALIAFYQKFLSPRKKYKCAKGELYKKATCSSTTKEAFKKHGFIAGMREYRRSTKQCKEAYNILHKDKRRDGSSCNDVLCSGCVDGSSSGCTSASSCGGEGASSTTSACDCGAIGSC